MQTDASEDVCLGLIREFVKEFIVYYHWKKCKIVKTLSGTSGGIEPHTQRSTTYNLLLYT